MSLNFSEKEFCVDPACSLLVRILFFGSLISVDAKNASRKRGICTLLTCDCLTTQTFDHDYR